MTAQMPPPSLAYHQALDCGAGAVTVVIGVGVGAGADSAEPMSCIHYGSKINFYM